MMSAMLLIWMRNSVGLSTVPCGTPDVTGFMLVVALPTVVVGPFRSYPSLCCSLYYCNLFNRHMCGTVECF